MSETAERLSISWIGHSTVLLESQGARILTDPVLRPRMAHLRRMVAAPTVTGVVDAVLISHVHYDHLDMRSLPLVRARRAIVPRGARRLLERSGFEDIVEVDEGDEVSVGPVVVRATHAQHPSRRFPLSSKIPALGYLLQNSQLVYFPGDTDVFDAMRELGSGLDVALVPVAGWGRRVGPGHLDPVRAVEALQLLRPRIAVPIHWGTYRQFGWPRDTATLREPAEQFERLAAELTPEVDVRLLVPGERLELPPQPAAAVGQNR